MKELHCSEIKITAMNQFPTRQRISLLLIFFSLFIFCPPVNASDSVMPLPDGGENIMVTFDELDPFTPFPLTYRGVTYTLIEGQMQLIWNAPGLPNTRYVKSPMLAQTAYVEETGEPTNLIVVRLDFETPTSIFGFGLGFNDRLNLANGAQLSDIGSVTLNFSNGGQKTFHLSASRVLCCTETRFDYTDSSDGIPGNSLVESAIITLDYRYEPFSPGSGYPGDPFIYKFMGLDDITYTTAATPAPIMVNIDIQPKKDVNVINIKSSGKVGVAILTEGEFYALDVNPDTVRFGPNQALSSRYTVVDIDKDGDDDLLVYFRIQELGISYGDTNATLTAELFDKSQLLGVDSILTKGCK